jgi:inorganic pyrophosphatase
MSQVLRSFFGKSATDCRTQMQLEKLPSGPDVPEEVYVVVEIPAYGPGIKFEFEKASGALLVDRFLATPMHYPCNYGFIPHTLSLDGDPLDALVVTPMPLISGTVIACRPIAVLQTEDDGGGDAKILAVPLSRITQQYDHIKEAADVPPLLIQQIEHFFSHYKDLEPGRWMTLKGWGDSKCAKQEIVDSVKRFATNPSGLNF